mmetsp:Transcript_36903/g.54194  ORF Transcript_36903/g.54194 Transcript_36903/m.54194 type:complete len:212 (-) Transcript_36903:327-962(-)|eukprot:CAMPEP_0195530988 /NCGR_PEP_ID=MMETSP0794_2-20130614/34104_1 /TAXON_ID=515487 /ORGANISM="Stephanopyxis turris, Strain CCMP 815" /LENGTH=211 /DNA_ID=CAMNT_0040662617 /DNA_START=200 /DNA_END=835 /DNA_ORIENTATION=+
MGKKGGKVRVKQVNQSAPMKNPLAGLEDIKIPPKLDPSVSYPWPPHDFSVLQDCNTFNVIYPTYLDSTKTIKRGRRIAIDDAQEKPSITEIGEALQSLNLRHVIEPAKGYSRDPDSRWDNLGRVLVDMTLPHDTDAVDGEDDKLKKVILMREISKRIPSMPSRLKRIAKEKAEKAKLIKAGSSQGGGSKSNASSGGGGSSSKKKKGKKKRS